MRLVRLILGLLLAIAIVAFAIANRQPVDVYWNPVGIPLHLPLYLVVLILMAFGFLLGASLVWLNKLPLRFTLRKQAKQIRALEKQIETAHETTVLPVLKETADE